MLKFFIGGLIGRILILILLFSAKSCLCTKIINRWLKGAIFADIVNPKYSNLLTSSRRETFKTTFVLMRFPSIENHAFSFLLFGMGK